MRGSSVIDGNMGREVCKGDDAGAGGCDGCAAASETEDDGSAAACEIESATPTGSETGCDSGWTGGGI